MRKAYSQISWGLALELIDIRIQNFDIFPDVLGYFLILIGLSSLHSSHRYFIIARVAAGVQVIGSIVQFSGMPMSVSLTNSEAPSVTVLLLTSIFIIIELVMLFGICEGIKASAHVQGKRGLAKSAGDCWKANFVLGTLFLLLFPYQLNSLPNDYVVLFFALGIGFFIANLCVISIVRKAGRQLIKKDGEPNGHLGQNIDFLG